MIRELTDQGADVAREHYGARGWVFHQNTDLWRVAAPMDGPSWGGFTTGGAWLVHAPVGALPLHRRPAFLREYYPVMKGAAEFFLDFLVPHPKHGWLVTNPSTSPENFPLAPGNDRFFDEVTGLDEPRHVARRGLDDRHADPPRPVRRRGRGRRGARHRRGASGAKVLAARARLAPMQIGRKGDLQEWLDDWGQREKSHRHISNLYGLYPGNQISARRTPALAEAAARRARAARPAGQRLVVGVEGGGWARLGNAREGDGERRLRASKLHDRQPLLDLLEGHAGGRRVRHDRGHRRDAAAVARGRAGAAAGAARPGGRTARCAACAPAAGSRSASRGRRGALERARRSSRARTPCRVRSAVPLTVTSAGKAVTVSRPDPDVVEFQTTAGASYVLTSSVDSCRRPPARASRGPSGAINVKNSSR